LRDPNEIQGVTRNAATLMLGATRLMLKKFRPEENVADWYKKEIRDRFLAFTSKPG
jgi:hypothetical protein